MLNLEKQIGFKAGPFFNGESRLPSTPTQGDIFLKLKTSISNRRLELKMGGINPPKTNTNLETKLLKDNMHPWTERIGC